ncbi:Dabb family protein [Muriicola marianensis]|uniref:Stress-response A/B barrel domain-containing protein n=1 Tax=Muriicola marianensis TaxID=1324801 RepID=A0ABQ1R3J5_9FLAO|nr:Dabb family protein [Muriicola marianensis]GGD56923.1 hypothetical protein GCM10011361_24300 [Muriicola marianensis]
MKIPLLGLALVLGFLLLRTEIIPVKRHIDTADTTQEKDSLLRHVVLFKFKAGASADEIAEVRKAFVDLKSKIPQIVNLEWGINNSPEGLDKGFTHCFFLTFKSEEDRDLYLPHPDHKAFGNLLGPILEDVLVVDYWAD